MLLLFYSGHFIDHINTSWNTIHIKCDFFFFFLQVGLHGLCCLIHLLYSWWTAWEWVRFRMGFIFFLCIKMHCNVFSEDFSVYRLYMLRVTIALNQNKDYVTENVLFFSSQTSTPLKSCISLTQRRHRRRTGKIDHFVCRKSFKDRRYSRQSKSYRLYTAYLIQNGLRWLFLHSKGSPPASLGELYGMCWCDSYFHYLLA